MKKILSLFFAIIFIALNCYGADITDWQRGDSSSPVKGTDNISDIDTLLDSYVVDPLERLLTENIHGCTLTYATAATVTISASEVVCYNAAKTVRRMRRNTATVTITLPASGASGDSLDTGNAATSTWYHVYAVADADATTFTGICSASASAPTGYTYFRYLGSFYNNASDNIALFYWDGNGSDIFIMWDIPISITTATSVGAWSAATSCAAGMPSTSTRAIFGLKETTTNSNVGLWIRPNGTTWSTDIENGVYHAGAGTDNLGMQRMCMTDSSQQIQYYMEAGDTAVAIDVEGFFIKR